MAGATVCRAPKLEAGSNPDGMLNTKGIRTSEITGTPFSVAGFIKNCGVSAMPADPKFSPTGLSEVTTHS